MHNQISHTQRQTAMTLVSFQPHLTMNDAYYLKVGDEIDHRDWAGQWFHATIIEKNGSILKMHYQGWSDKFDEWSDYQKEIYRFAPADSISKRPAERFQNLNRGDFIDINPSYRKGHAGWVEGEIIKISKQKREVRVRYNDPQKDGWNAICAHLDNTHEIAVFRSKSGKKQNNANINVDTFNLGQLSRTLHDIDDIVMYNGIEAQIAQNMGMDKFGITYPLNVSYNQRSKKIVNGGWEIQVKYINIQMIILLCTCF